MTELKGLLDNDATTTDEFQAAITKLGASSQKMGAAMYEAAAADAAAAEAPEGDATSADDDVVDAEIVDDEGEQK